MAENKKHNVKRLAKNFHRTFIPERQYLGALLRYAAGTGQYDLEAIAVATDIPTGKSSGKAMPTADYAIGMGLAKLIPDGDPKERRFLIGLTDFGRAVYLGDPFLQEEMTQWLAHLNLCNRQDGAELWYQLFWNGSSTFGMNFSYADFLSWAATEIHANDTGKAFSPLFRMYTETASFASCGAVEVDGDAVVRKLSPIDAAYSIGYAAWIAGRMETAGRPVQSQFTVDDVESVCGVRAVTGWSATEAGQVLQMMEDRGLVAIDRHMQPWIVSFRQGAAQLWSQIYEEFRRVLFRSFSMVRLTLIGSVISPGVRKRRRARSSSTVQRLTGLRKGM